MRCLLFTALLFMQFSVTFAQDKSVAQAIEEANREIASALVAGSPERYAAAFTEDGSLLAPGVHVKGRENIREQQRSWFAQVLVVKAQLNTEHLDVQGSLAHEIGTFRYTFQKREQLDSWVVEGRYLAIWERQENGSWKLKADAGMPTPGS